MEEQNGPNVAELAKDATKRDSGFIGVPLTVLAPVLVALALVGVLLPNTYILQNASEATTSDLADKYLSSLLGNVKLQTESVLAPLPPLVKGIRDLSSTKALFAGPWENFQTKVEFISNLAHLWASYKLDAISCNSARWLPGHTNAEVFDYRNIDFGVIQVVRPPSAEHSTETELCESSPLQPQKRVTACGIEFDTTAYGTLLIIS
ncbi:hypothetical protein BDZ88DRAFT_71798 [Geranomyces variabilis]|nr:hypothetical protein BDZ88DRAFT_71798 [Geranomyces variabilis]